ncbi:MAG: alpha-2-macroglobulin family protein, partial [Candidatus Sericytochromatia bacterium]
MSDATQPIRVFQPLMLLLALAFLAVLGAGAIALERPVGQAVGTVHNADGTQPLPDARITVSGPVTRTIEADAEGRFRFHNLPVGSYYVSARARRYDPQWHTGEIKIVEGQTTEGLAFRLMRTQPSFFLTNVQRVFTPDEPVRITARGTLVNDLGVTLYRLDLDKVLARSRDVEALRRPDVAALERMGALTPVKDWRQAVRAEEEGDDGWYFKTLQMPELGVGSYLVALKGQPEQGPEEATAPQTIERAYWFEVSRLALVTKRSDDQLLAYAVDLVSKHPVPGARVQVLGGPAGVSDASGLVRLNGALPGGNATIVGSHEGSHAIARAWHYPAGEGLRLYAYTDRPVYRPGQTVYFKGIVRHQREARYRPAAGTRVTARVKDAKGTLLLTRQFTVDAASAFNGEVALPPEAPLGEYAIELTGPSESYEQIAFKVSDYRKPEFKVEINPAKGRYTMGQTADVHLLANYYFGAPVPGAKLLVTVYSAPLYWERDPDADFFAGYTAEPGLEPYWGYGDVVHQVEGTTDSEGKYHFKMPLERPAEGGDGWIGSRVYTVSVEAMDAAQRPVKARNSFHVTQGDVRLKLETEQSVYTGESGIAVQAKVQTYEGEPVQAGIQVKAERLVWEEKETKEGDQYTETRRETVWSGELQTDEHGTGRLVIPSLGEGSYEITATTRDGRGNEVTDRTWAWVAGEDATAGSYRYDALQVITDKKVYRPGDTAKVLVVSPVADLSVLLTIEGTKLHSARVVRMKGTSAMIEVPVTEAYQPNAFVVATAVNGKEYMVTERSLNVLPEEKFLQVAVTTDKSRYEPGEKATYTIETRDHAGRPVAADVSLGVVDEAIYAIEPETTADIRAFFHGPRWNHVSSSHSFAEDYSGGLDKNAPDPRVRAKFEDTAAWFPSIKTGPSGKAVVEVQLPDNLTTWVATARAATLQTQVGTARHNVVATKDLLVRLETPRFVVEGDRAEISAIAHNYTETEQEVELSLAVTGLVLEDARPKTVAIAPGDAQRVAWSARVESVGEATATVKARSNTAGDAMQLPFPAKPFGAPGFDAAAAEASGASAAGMTIELPAGAIPATTRLEVQLRTNPLPTILAAVDYLHQYEYGCVEQTMSRFLPDVALPRRLAPLGAPLGDRFAGQDQRVKDGVQRLVGMQRGHGAWGWWSHDEGDVLMTSYVLYGLAEARRAGAAVPQDAARRAADYLVRTLPKIGQDLYTRHTVSRDAGADTRAFALFALAWWDKAPRAEIDRLWADRQGLSPFGLAQLTHVLGQTGDPRRFEALDMLEAKAVVEGIQAHLPADAPEFAWQDNSVEATAYGLRAYLAVSPEAAMVPKMVRWLEAQNTRGYWVSTKDTGAAAIALAET